jgi:hypothetical protein
MTKTDWIFETSRTRFSRLAPWALVAVGLLAMAAILFI